MLDSSIETNNWNSYTSIDKCFIIFQYLLSKCNLQVQTIISNHQTDILLSSKLCTQSSLWLVKSWSICHKYEAIVSNLEMSSYNFSTYCIGMWWPTTWMITLSDCFYLLSWSVLNFQETCTTCQPPRLWLSVLIRFHVFSFFSFFLLSSFHLSEL